MRQQRDKHVLEHRVWHVIGRYEDNQGRQRNSQESRVLPAYRDPEAGRHPGLSWQDGDPAVQAAVQRGRRSERLISAMMKEPPMNGIPNATNPKTVLVTG